MRNIVIVLRICLIFLSACKTKNNANEATLKTTEMEMLQTQQDFGKIRIGDTLTGFFVVKNIGNEDLVFKEIFGDCGCTTVHNNNKSLHKGELDTIRFAVNTKGKKRGRMRRTIAVFANTDPELNKFKITAELE